MLSAVETFGPAAASATNAYAAAAAAAAAAQQHHHHNSHLQHLPQQHHHHQLAHHNPFALAAAAAASVVMPPTQGQTETNQLSLDHYTIAGHGPLLGHHPHLNSHSHHLNHLNHLTHPSGIYLSSLPSVIPSTTAAVTSSMSLLRQQHQQQHRDSIVSSTLLPSPPSSSSSISYSLSTTASNNSAISPCSSPAKSPSSSSTIRSIKDSSNTSNLINNNNNNSHNNNLMIDNNKTTVSTMSITEFVRPHPKQPRYNSNSNGSNNNNNNNNNNNSNSLNNNNNNNSINNNTIGSNGIPLLGRNKLSPPSSEYLNGNSPKNSLSKYSNEPPQTGPVNLVTNNNNNNNRDYSKGFNKETNNNNRITPPNSLTDLDLKKASGTDISCSTENLTKDNLCTSLYSQKLQFTPPTAALAAPYQFNYPSLYARGAIYGTPALYSGHHPALNGRSNQIVHSRPPAFLNSAHPELQPFSQYLSPTVVYSPPGTNTSTTAVGSGGIPVPSLQQQASPTNLLRSSTVVNENLPNSKSPLQSQLPLQSPLSPSQQKTSPNLSQQQSQQSSTSQSFVPQSSSLPQSNFITATEQQRALLGQQQQQQQQHHHSYYQQQQHHHHHQHQSDKNMGGIKLTVNNDKKLHQNNSNDGGSFKVPSGKEGSLKHRFLTRPKSDRDLKRRSPNSINRHQNNSNGSSAPSNFTKGSYIELANGLLRRVEDMRTEDFIQSAEKSERHQLVDSTVVKISNTPNSVIITFSYDKNRSKADIEVSQEHPFFVYGQGWASCNPDISLQHFGLKCKRLQVGDVCISLIEVTSPTATSSTSSLSTLSSIGKNPSSSSCSSSCSSDSCITNSPSASPIIDVTTVAPNQPQNLTTTGSGSIRLNTNTTTIDDIKNQVNHYHHNTLPQLSSYDMHHNNMQQTQHNSRNVGSYDGSISRHHASNNNNNNNNTNSIAANTPLILQNGVNNNRDIVNHHSHHSHHNHHLTQQNNLQQHSQQQQQQQQRIGSGKHSSLSDSHYLIPPQSHGHPLALHQHQQQSLTAPSSTKNIEFKFSSPSIHQQQQQQQQQQQPFYLGKSATLLAPTTCRSASPPRINHHQSQNYHKSSDESHDSIFDSSDINTNISRKRRWSAPEDKCDDDNHNDNENNNNNNNNNDNGNCNSNGERHEKISANGKNNNRNSDGDN